MFRQTRLRPPASLTLQARAATALSPDCSYPGKADVVLQAHISQLIYYSDELPQVLIDGRHAGLAPAASRRPVLEPKTSSATDARLLMLCSGNRTGLQAE